jgi:ubiquinone/menaquinone biosynthesis C-methylase UbiE
MTIFDEIASDYDRGMVPLEWLIFRHLRRRLFPGLQGRVLELAIGTGVNLSLYPAGCRVIGCDISREMLQHASQRASKAGVPLLQADARHLPFASDAFDVVSASLAFCSIAEPLKGLREARRVLRAGGHLALLEHTRGSGLGAWLTDILHPLWHAKSRECHLNRETTRYVAQAGFVVERVRRYVLGIVRLIEARG